MRSRKVHGKILNILIRQYIFNFCLQDECMLRFKYLAELVRKKKQALEEPTQEETPDERADDNVCVEESEQ
jgi:hypothetical protein